MTPPSTPELSIVIVSYNARRELEACLASLAAHPPAIPHEVVVVDNASTDGSAEAVAANAPWARLIRQSQNSGFAAANNVGIRRTSGELILLLNSDTVVCQGAIDTLVDRLRAWPSAAAAGPKLVGADGRVELSFGPMIGPVAELRQKAIVRLYERGFGPAVRWVQRVTTAEHVVDWVSGAALLVHRRDAEAAGLLDERFFLYTEDVDFCAALRARGRQVLFTPAAQITHLRGRSRASAPDRMNAAYRRSQLAFYAKHHPMWLPVLKTYLRLKREMPTHDQRPKTKDQRLRTNDDHC